MVNKSRRVKLWIVDYIVDKQAIDVFIDRILMEMVFRSTFTRPWDMCVCVSVPI